MGHSRDFSGPRPAENRRSRAAPQRMLYSRRMRLASVVVVALFWLSCLLPISTAQTPTSSAPEDYSGMYSFVKDGEFIQITEEDKGAVSGFISRYGDSDADKGAFIDQFVKSGTGALSN